MRIVTRDFIALAGLSALVSTVSVSALAAELQVVTEAGVEIYLDGKLIGTTTERDGGLYITGLTEGKHKLKAVMKGYEPQEVTVAVVEGRTATVSISMTATRERVRNMDAHQSVSMKTETGTIELRSIPPHPPATVYVNGDRKGEGQLRIEGVPKGNVRIKVVRGSGVVTAEYYLGSEKRIVLTAHFGTDQIYRVKVRGDPDPCTGYYYELYAEDGFKTTVEGTLRSLARGEGVSMEGPEDCGEDTRDGMGSVGCEILMKGSWGDPERVDIADTEVYKALIGVADFEAFDPGGEAILLGPPRRHGECRATQIVTLNQRSKSIKVEYGVVPDAVARVWRSRMERIE